MGPCSAHDAATPHISAVGDVNCGIILSTVPVRRISLPVTKQNLETKTTKAVKSTLVKYENL